MTHEPEITYVCSACGWIYEDWRGPDGKCPKCFSPRRREIHSTCEDDVLESQPRERY